MDFHGHISEDGTLKIVNRKGLNDWIRNNPGRNIKLSIELKRKKRTTPQNAYYWGAIIPLITQAMNDLGNEFDEDTAHDFLKKEFNYKEIESNGHNIRIPVSTTKLTTVEFNEYIEKIQQFAATVLGIVIPDPNQALQIDFK